MEKGPSTDSQTGLRCDRPETWLQEVRMRLQEADKKRERAMEVSQIERNQSFVINGIFLISKAI